MHKAIIKIQLAKIVLLPPKYEIIIMPSNHSFFQYCESNIRLFSIAPCKVITLLTLFASFFLSVLCFFFDGSLSKVIALLTIAIAIVVALSRLKGDSEKITVTFRKRLYEPKRATTVPVAMEER